MEVEITQTLRPLRLLFLIAPNNIKSFQKAVNLGSAYYGGKYFPIIPFYQKFSSKYMDEQQLYGSKIGNYYNQIIENYMVDIVVYDDELSIEKIKKFVIGKDIIPLSNIENSLCTDEPRFGFALHQVISMLKTKEFKYVRTDGKEILLTKTSKDAMMWQVLFGNVDIKYQKYLQEQGGLNISDFVMISSVNGMKFLDPKYQNYLSINSYDILIDGADRDVVYFMQENDLAALNNFWNLRALGWKIICVPYNQMNSTEIKHQLSLILAKYNKDNFWRLTILGISKANDKQKTEFIDLLYQLNNNSNKGYTFQWWIPRYWEDNVYKRADHVFAGRISMKSKNSKFDIENYIYLPVIKPDFMLDYYHSHIDPVYSNSLTIRIKSDTLDFVEIFPRVNNNDVSRLIRTGEKASVSAKGLNFYLQLHSNSIGFHLPQSDAIMAHLFVPLKLSIKPSSAGKLTREVLKNIGGIYGTNIFFNQTMIDLLLMFENNKIVSKKTIYDYLQRHKSKLLFKQETKRTIQYLIDKKIIRLGTQVICNYCNRNSFYLINELDYDIKCKICQNLFGLPTADPNAIIWAYQGIGPFALNNRAEGIISVLLTLRFFKISMFGINATTSVLSTDVLMGNEVVNEIDLTLFQEGDWSAHSYPDLIFCECKTYNSFSGDDVSKMQKLAKLFPGSILLFATLKKQLTTNEKKAIKKLANSFRNGNNFRPINPILILTGNELLPSNPLDSLEKLEQHKIQNYHNDDSLGHLCEMSTLEYLGLRHYRKIIEERYEKKWAKIEASINLKNSKDL